MMFLANSPSSLATWYADSGASPHMAPYREIFRAFCPISEGLWPVQAVAGQSNWICGIGDIDLLTFIHG